MKTKLLLILLSISYLNSFSQNSFDKLNQIKAHFEDSLFNRTNWLNKQFNLSNKKTRLTGYRLKATSYYHDLQLTAPIDSLYYNYSGSAGSYQNYESFQIDKDFDDETKLLYSGSWKNSEKTLLVRNINLQVEKKIVLKWNLVTSSWDSLRKIEYLYNGNQQLIKETWFDWISNSWQNNTNYDYFYSTFLLDSTHQKIWDVPAASWINKQRILNTYSSNILSQQIIINWMTSTTSWKNSMKQNYQYNGNNISETQLSFWVSSQNNWVLQEKKTFQYTSNDQITDASTYGWDSTTSTWIHNMQWVTTYIGKMYDSVLYRYLNAQSPNWYYDYSAKHHKNINNMSYDIWFYSGDINTTSTSGWKLGGRDSINYFNDSLFNQHIHYIWNGTNFVYDTNAFHGVINYFYEPYSMALQTSEFQEVSNIHCYPNPADKYLYLEFKMEDNAQITYNILDIFGRVRKSEVMAGYTGNHLARIELDNLSPGIYFVQLVNNNVTSKLSKIVKSRRSTQLYFKHNDCGICYLGTCVTFAMS